MYKKLGSYSRKRKPSKRKGAALRAEKQLRRAQRKGLNSRKLAGWPV